MSILSTLVGHGTLVTADRRTEVSYKLSVIENRGARGGRGSFRGNIPDLIDAFQAGKSTLHLQNGDPVEVVINRVDGSHCQFSTSGAVPGF